MSGGELLLEVEGLELSLLPISPAHAAAIDTLPLHHSDPFDRMLLAQAQCEQLTLLTHDQTLAPYGDFVLVV